MGKGDNIVIPKSILERFIEEDKRVSCLDLEKYIIKKKYPDSIFVKKNYYKKDIDKYIKDNVETIIGIINKSFTNNTNKKIEIKKDFIKSMKKIFFIQMFRNNNIPKDIINNSNFLKDAGGEKESTAHNIALAEIINNLENRCSEKNSKFNIAFNKMIEFYKTFIPGYIYLENTLRTFIIPESQFTKVKIKDREVYLYPISPILCLTWEERKNNKEEFSIGKTCDDKVVEKINKFIIENEKLKVDCLVIGKHEEINRLLLKITTEGK